MKIHNYGCKKLYEIGPRAQCYKSFFVCDLRIFLISQSVCPWQVFPAQSIDCMEQMKDSSLGQAPVLQTDQVKQACQGQTLQLITNICKLRQKKFFNIGPRLFISGLVTSGSSRGPCRPHVRHLQLRTPVQHVLAVNLINSLRLQFTTVRCQVGTI